MREDVKVFDFITNNNVEEINLITEALGSFKKQEEISEYIADLFFKMYDNHDKMIETYVLIDNEKVNLTLQLECDSYISKSRAEIMPCGTKSDDGTYNIENFKITLYLSENEVEDDENKTKKYIGSIISHELGHGNIFWKRAEAKQDIQTGDWYSKVIGILKNEYTSYPVYLFAYAMYSCYYQEKQAIVSSTFSQLLEKYPENRLDFIKNKLNNYTDYNKKYEYLLSLYKKDLIDTEAYKIYYTVVNYLPKIINEKTKREIIEVFRINGIDINIEKELKKIDKLGRGGLKDVIRNGSLFFNEFLLKKLVSE